MRRMMAVLLLAAAAGCDDPGTSAGGGAALLQSTVEAGNITAAKAALLNVISLVKSGALDEAKRHISGPVLADMEKAGQVEAALDMIAGGDVNAMKAVVEGPRVRFTREEKQGGMTASFNIVMVQEDGRWKLGR